MENLFLSVTTHMKSKWMPLMCSSHHPPGQPSPLAEARPGTSISRPWGKPQCRPFTPPVQSRPLVSWGKRRHPSGHWSGSVYPYCYPNLPELSTDLAAGPGTHHSLSQGQRRQRVPMNENWELSGQAGPSVCCLRGTTCPFLLGKFIFFN